MPAVLKKCQKMAISLISTDDRKRVIFLLHPGVEYGRTQFHAGKRGPQCTRIGRLPGVRIEQLAFNEEVPPMSPELSELIDQTEEIVNRKWESFVVIDLQGRKEFPKRRLSLWSIFPEHLPTVGQAFDTVELYKVTKIEIQDDKIVIDTHDDRYTLRPRQETEDEGFCPFCQTDVSGEDCEHSVMRDHEDATTIQSQYREYDYQHTSMKEHLEAFKPSRSVTSAQFPSRATQTGWDHETVWVVPDTEAFLKYLQKALLGAIMDYLDDENQYTVSKDGSTVRVSFELDDFYENDLEQLEPEFSARIHGLALKVAGLPESSSIENYWAEGNQAHKTWEVRFEIP
jgi:hypothetical protein